MWDHHEGWGHFENAKEPMCDQCYVEPITRCSFVGSSCTNALSIHTGPMFQFMHAQPAGHRMPFHVECLLPDWCHEALRITFLQNNKVLSRIATIGISMIIDTIFIWLHVFRRQKGFVVVPAICHLKLHQQMTQPQQVTS